MNFPNLVFNVHVYCGARSPVTGNPTNVDACADQEQHSLGGAASRTAPPWPRPRSPAGRPGWSPSSAPAATRASWRRLTAALDAATGQLDLLGLEVLRRSDGERRRVARHGQRAPALDRRWSSARPIREAVAGTPLRFSLLTADRRLRHGLRAEPPPRMRRRVIFVPTAVPLPARLLRPHDRGQRHVGPGERPARRCATTGRAAASRCEVTPGRCKAGRLAVSRT